MFLRFYQWIEGSWAILASHPRDFTPVCTTEAARMATLSSAFASRGVKLALLSCDPVTLHNAWATDICAVAGCAALPYPILADPDRVLASAWGMLDWEEKDESQLPVTVRAVYMIGPDKRCRAQIVYPPAVGRNFDEILRAIDALQRIEGRPEATPVDWQPGQPVMVAPTLSDAEVEARYPDVSVQAVPSGKTYLRRTAGV